MLSPQLLALREAWSNLEEPERTGFLKRLVYSRAFEVIITLSIVANTMCTTYQADFEIQHLGATPPVGVIMDGTFLAIFAMEMLLKLVVHRWYFFVNDEMHWNWFDFVLVVFSAMDFVFAEAAIVRISFARSLRIFKLGKVLRVFRTVRFLKELRVMVTSIIGSLVSLGWSIVMLGLILFVFALFFVQQMAVYLSSLGPSGVGTELFDDQSAYFRSVRTAMLTLSMCTTGGRDWEDIWRLIEPLGTGPALAFVFYIAFFTFAVLNILTGIFVESALSLAKPTEQEALKQSRLQAEEEGEELTMILEALDDDGDGLMSMSEFASAMTNDRIVHLLHRVGVDIKDAELFFTTVASLGNRQDAIEIPEFVAQVMRLRGQALSIDLHAVLLQLHALQDTLARKFDELRKEQMSIRSSLIANATPVGKGVLAIDTTEMIIRDRF
eukprot:CAMPEP_0176213856 /NCGR_PEP_ID=MMETSP0121_2-20121125/15875_1 /TAXON_ID=160619 /ORGANISM="Kryptoperidinium foliaceum, Strain CCMP 1326" /LENGTH=438 /DNA_ID=CAMNT_0017552933 /DNA_START=1 /DNA_END=1317 /DNA_ORIENTATION=-